MRIHLYFRTEPQKDRFIKGDRYLISLIKKFLDQKKTSGVEKVFVNLCKGFDQLKIEYDINLPFKKIKSGEPVIVLGNGKYALQGYKQSNPVIAGIGLMTHPKEWPDLFEEYPVIKYLQHSEWAKNIYVSAYGDEKCGLWPAGIDTEKWLPVSQLTEKKFDLLIYNKIMWNKQQTDKELRLPIIKKLEQSGLSCHEITYGQYQESEYYNLLQQSRAMIFLCEHESQGFALCEALSVNVPVLAWDQGFWLDPNCINREEMNQVPATSVPFFDDRCGMRFTNFDNFEIQINIFFDKVKSGDFSPRNYVLENLTLKKSAQSMLEIIDSVYK
jgi:glycosyltransferase involved in cell wall biosynthesis